MSNLKNKLRENKISIGTWMSLPSPSIAEILSNSLFDWIAIDLEHSTININQAEELIRIVDLSKKTALVRLTDNDSNQIKRVMDAGAHGIIVPMINNEKELLKAIHSTRYYPDGERGVGLARAQKYGKNFKSYFKWQKKQPIVIAQIENKKALDNLDNIFSVKDLDGYIIGPYDLSASLGCPGEFKNPNYLKAVKKITNTAKKYKCSSGIHIVEPDIQELKKAINNNFNFIAFSVDIRIIDNFVSISDKFIKNITK